MYCMFIHTSMLDTEEQMKALTSQLCFFKTSVSLCRKVLDLVWGLILAKIWVHTKLPLIIIKSVLQIKAAVSSPLVRFPHPMHMCVRICLLVLPVMNSSPLSLSNWISQAGLSGIASGCCLNTTAHDSHIHTHTLNVQQGPSLSHTLSIVPLIVKYNEWIGFKSQNRPYQCQSLPAWEDYHANRISWMHTH